MNCISHKWTVFFIRNDFTLRIIVSNVVHFSVRPSFYQKPDIVMIAWIEVSYERLKKRR